MALTNEEIRLAMQIALLGEIYSEIRAIAFQYNLQKKRFMIKYYLSRKPTDVDYESISTVMTDFIANFKYTEFEELKEECDYCILPKDKIDALDGFVYFRKEE